MMFWVAAVAPDANVRTMAETAAELNQFILLPFYKSLVMKSF